MTTTSYLSNAHNLKIDNISINNHSGATKQALDLLHEKSALGALHNSAERCDAPKCHTETRVAVQQEIFSWIAHGERDAEPKTVLWISGPAGCGKTAIAGSIAETCKDKALLAASFFFSSYSGSYARRSKTHLVATIAYQLLQHDVMQEAGRRILSCLQKNPGVFETRLTDQFEELLLRPLRDYRREGGDLSGWPKVIIIDGLDEVEPDLNPMLPPSARTTKASVHVEILSAFMQAAREPSFPFSIVIVSRPERAIRDFFSNEAKDSTRNVFLDEKYDPDSDILLLFQSKFTQIRRQYHLPATWPGEEAIRTLVDSASGQFIYAATVLRFVQDPIQLPQFQLECVLGLSPIGQNSNPFVPLDALYTRILRGSPNPHLVIMWLEAMSWGPRSAPGVFWRQFLESTPGESEHLFANLSSLISVPPIGDSAAQYTLYHKSFRDYTDDPSRCGELYVPIGGRDGRRFFFEYRILQAIKNKGPAVPVTEEEHHLFLENFFQLDFDVGTVYLEPRGLSDWTIVDVSWASRTMPKKDLIACDADWFICKAIEYLPLHDTVHITQARDVHIICPRVSVTVMAAFWHIHHSCRWYRCRAVCKHWRATILRVCKERGWTIPGKITLFRNRFTQYGPPVYPRAGGSSYLPPLPNIHHFTPPG